MDSVEQKKNIFHHEILMLWIQLSKEKNFHHKIFIRSKNELPMQNDIFLSEADYN